VYFPGAPFFASAILTALAMVLLLRTVAGRQQAQTVASDNPPGQ
jgi:hypothetical protein